MIRSSRIPPLLDKICTDGILSTLLITTDGELLGSSTTSKKDNTPTNAMTIDNTNVQIVNSTLDKHVNQETIPTDTNSSSTSQTSPPSWVNVNPSDVGAIIAEVIQDYKLLGCELAILDPSFTFHGESSSRDGNRSKETGSGGGGGVGDGTTQATSNSSGGSTNDQIDKQQSTHVSSPEDGGATKNNIVSSASSSNDTNKMKESNTRDKGRLNCLIMELDMVRL